MSIIYKVRVTREDGQWLGEVTNRTGIQTFARTYTGLRKEMDEAIRVMDDLDDDATVTTEWTFDGVDLDFVAAARIGDRRKTLENEVASLARHAQTCARLLQRKGYSVRDIGGALEMTAGRVSQILNEPFRGTLEEHVPIEDRVHARGDGRRHEVA